MTSFKYYFLCIFLFSVFKLNAQDFDPSIHKNNVSRDKYEGVNGQPFLFKDWVKGNLKTTNGGELKDVLLKFDEVTDLIYTQDVEGKMVTFSDPVLEFILTDGKGLNRKFKAGFAPTKETNANSFFEVLADGKTKFLKRNKKSLSQNTEYSGAISKTIVDNIKYYIAKENEPIAIKLDQNSIFGLLADKNTQLVEFVKNNKLNLKKVDDVIKVMSYYNTL